MELTERFVDGCVTVSVHVCADTCRGQPGGQSWVLFLGCHLPFPCLKGMVPPWLAAQKWASLPVQGAPAALSVPWGWAYKHMPPCAFCF